MKLISLPFIYCLLFSSVVTGHDEVSSSNRSADHNDTLSLNGNELRNVQENSQLCKISTTVNCFVQEKGKSNLTKCEDMAPVEDCGPIEMLFVFEYCNRMNTFDVSLLDKKTFAKVAGKAYRDPQGVLDLNRDACRSFKQNVAIDSCLRSNVPGSFKAEGWIKGYEQTFGYYCYAWDFQKIRIGRTPPVGQSAKPTTWPTQTASATPSVSLVPTPSPSNNPSTTTKPTLKPTKTASVNPTEVPTNEFTSNPSLVPTIETTTITPSFADQIPSTGAPVISDTSTSPSRGPIVTSVNLNSKCLGEPQGFIGSGAFVLGCEYLVPSASGDDCVRDIKLLYTIENESNEDLIVQGLIVGQGGIFDELINSDTSLKLEPSETHTIEHILKSDICSEELSNRKVDAIVFGIGVDSGIPVSKGGDMVLAIPVPSRIQLVPPIICAVDGIPCSDYLALNNECIVTAKLRYPVQNIGLACFDIETVQLQFGSEDIQELSIGATGIITNFCPQDIYPFEHTQTLDLCKYQEDPPQIEVSMNNSSDMKATETLSFNQSPAISFASEPTPIPSNNPTKYPKTWSPPIQTPKPTSPTRAPAFTSKSFMPGQVPTIEEPNKAPVMLTPDAVACDKLPNAISFIFKPGSCRDGNNYQFKSKREKKMHKKYSEKYAGKGIVSKKVKSDCSDHSTVKAMSRLVVSSDFDSTVLFDDIITKNEKVAIKNFSGIDKVKVFIYTLNDSLSQSFVVDLSCEMNISHGESFGSLVFAGYEKFP